MLSVHIIQKGRKEKDHIWIIRWTKTQELGCCSGTWEEADEYARKKNKGDYIIWQISFYARKPRDPKLIALKNRLNELGYHPTIAHEYVTEDRVWHSYFSITTDGVIG